MKHKHFYTGLAALFLSCSIVSCCYEREYVYTIRNETGVRLKINPYDYENQIVQEKVIILNDKEEFTHKYISRDARVHFWPSDYFRSQYLEVIYNNEKKEIFPYSWHELEDSLRDALEVYIDTLRIYTYKDPLNYQDFDEPFIFTEEDYENATPCEGDCE
tara:strand:- start:572 stop:1051 length:480 start_codon:yes stop_codon:yes gene_type:complete